MKRRSKDWDRFWSKVKKGPGCWEWQASCSPTGGYGSFSIKGKGQGAHRVVYRMGHGDIPKGMCVCHYCDNKKCVRPSHLFIGTYRDNLIDSLNKNLRSRVKLTNKQVLAIRKDTRRISFIGRDYDVDNTTISRIKNRTRWKHVPEETADELT